ncbi:DUF6207 family protein [Streptomyces sp. NPDC001698]|uniref:DUF6207 family protein n=1 Tax=unclassified Streptomyces TaxID=2593676 RepID=UPI00367859A9
MTRAFHREHPAAWQAPTASADDETAFTVQELLAARCAVAPAERTTREPDKPGVRLRFFLDLQQDADTYARGRHLAVLVPGRDGASRLIVLGLPEVCHAREHLRRNRARL